MFIQRGFTRGDDGVAAVAPWLQPSGPEARVPSFGAAASVAKTMANYGKSPTRRIDKH